MDAKVIEQLMERRFSAEEMDRFRIVIRAFNRLYYDYPQQTWKNTKWRGVHVYKTPTDLWIYQELMQVIRPDVVIETGTAEGGSALYLSDMMRCMGIYGSVLSIDVNHDHVSRELENCANIDFIRGDSASEETIGRVQSYLAGGPTRKMNPKVMVILDSDHSKEHVLKELELYSPLVSSESILIVEDMNTDGPLHAVREWLPFHLEFEENHMCEKFMLTFNRGGYLERKQE